MGNNAKNKRRARGRGGNEHAMVRSIDELIKMEEFKDMILSPVMQDLKDGMTSDQIRKKWAPFIQAMQATTALSNPDPKARLQAAKDILDRVEGKPKESKEITHRLGELPEEQVDALLMSDLEVITQLEADEED